MGRANFRKSSTFVADGRPFAVEFASGKRAKDLVGVIQLFIY